MKNSVENTTPPARTKQKSLDSEESLAQHCIARDNDSARFTRRSHANERERGRNKNRRHQFCFVARRNFSKKKKMLRMRSDYNNTLRASVSNEREPRKAISIIRDFSIPFSDLERREDKTEMAYALFYSREISIEAVLLKKPRESHALRLMRCLSAVIIHDVCVCAYVYMARVYNKVSPPLLLYTRRVRV